MTNPTQRRSIWTRLYHGETDFDFMGKRRWCFAASALVILLGLIALGVNGLNRGIEFRGGTSWEVPARGFSVTEAREALPSALQDAKVQQVGTDKVRVQADPGGSGDERRETVEDVTSRLAKAAGVATNSVSVNDVGPTWGEEISRKALRALVVFLVLISIYIWWRFDRKMAAATMAALVHDILVTAGVYAIFQLEVTPPTVIAILTILGYSIYDGIVVFDKVEENTKPLAESGKLTYSEMVNASLNQVLMRTLNTSLTALLPILSLLVIGSYVLGATTLEEFAVALLVGLGASAYSSIFIASPVLAILKEREPRYQQIRERIALTGRRVSGPPLVPGMATASVGAPVGVPRLPGENVAFDDRTGPSAPSAPAPGGSIGARPAITARGRKQRRRK